MPSAPELGRRPKPWLLPTGPSTWNESVEAATVLILRRTRRTDNPLTLDSRWARRETKMPAQLGGTITDLDLPGWGQSMELPLLLPIPATRAGTFDLPRVLMMPERYCRPSSIVQAWVQT